MNVLKSSILCLVFLVACYTPVDCQAQPTRLNFLYTFSDDTALLESGMFASYADTDRFFLFGGTITPPISDQHAFTAAFDYSGQLLWKHKLFFPGRYNSAAGSDVLTTSGPNIIAGGMIIDESINANLIVRYPYLFRFTKNGDSLFFRKYPDTSQTSGYTSITTDASQKIVGAGVISSKTYKVISGSAHYDSFSVWLVKYDSSGNLLWDRKFYTNPTTLGTGTVNKVAVTSDQQHYLLGGAMPHPLLKFLYPTIIRTDSSGNPIWTRQLHCGFASNQTDMDLVPSSDGGCYYAATWSKYPYSATGGQQFYQIVYGKLDSNGSEVWQIRFSRDSLWLAVAKKIALTDDGHLIISGLASGDGTYAQNYVRPVLMKMDTLGNVKWYREKQRIDHFGPEQLLFTLNATTGSRIVQAGHIYTTYKIPTLYDTLGTLSWVVVSDSLGLSRPEDTLLAVTELTPTAVLPAAVLASYPVEVYPNPARESLTIKAGNLSEELRLVLADVAGRRFDMGVCRSNDQKQIDLTPFPAGTYMLELEAGGKRIKTYRVVHY